MKQSFILQLRSGSDVRKHAFKTMTTKDNYALLVRANHQLAFDFANSREKSALFQKEDCFECLSPHKIAA